MARYARREEPAARPAPDGTVALLVAHDRAVTPQEGGGPRFQGTAWGLFGPAVPVSAGR